MAEDAITEWETPHNFDPPKAFNGRSDPLNTSYFLTTMEVHLYRIRFKNDYKKILYFGDCLTDSAASWFHMTLINDIHEDDSFETFMKLFKERYFNKHQKESLLYSLLRCRQTGSVSDYNKEFSKFSSAVPATVLPDQSKFYAYLSGLKPSIAVAVRNSRPDSLDTAMFRASNNEKSERAIELEKRSNSEFENTSRRKRRSFNNNDHYQGQTYNERPRPSASERKKSRKMGICPRCRSGKHWSRDCPEAMSFWQTPRLMYICLNRLRPKV